MYKQLLSTVELDSLILQQIHESIACSYNTTQVAIQTTQPVESLWENHHYTCAESDFAETNPADLIL